MTITIAVGLAGIAINSALFIWSFLRSWDDGFGWEFTGILAGLLLVQGLINHKSIAWAQAALLS